VTRAEIERDPITYIQHVDGVMAATSQQLAEFREETGREFAAVRSEMAQFQSEVRGEFAEVRGQLAEVNAALVQVVARLPAPPH
jgi:hypothetical protein